MVQIHLFFRQMLLYPGLKCQFCSTKKKKKKSHLSNFFHISTSQLLAMTFIFVLQNRAHPLSKLV